MKATLLNKALYDGHIRKADALFGQLIEKLESLDLLSATVIVIVSDHGEEFCDHFIEEAPPKSPSLIPQISYVNHGHSVYDELIRVPVIFYLPGLQPETSILENQVRLIDVMPTVLDYLGISYDGPVQGTSLLPLIKKGERLYDPPVISEHLLYGYERKSIRVNGYKYIHTMNPANVNNANGNGHFWNSPRYALFDLKNDPEEMNNIYDQNKELAKEYHTILEQTLEESAEINSTLQKNFQSMEGEPAESRLDLADTLKALGYLQ
jgi:arylsulfatase A-like enzyme